MTSKSQTISNMTITKQTAKEDWLARILDSNPQIDRDTLERSRRVTEQLEAVGIKLGGYRLEPALGGPTRFPTRPRNIMKAFLATPPRKRDD